MRLLDLFCGMKVEIRTPDTKETELITEQEYYMRLMREPADGDAAQPQCCMGLGYVRMIRPVGHSAFGQYQKCTRCYPWKATEPRPER